MSKILQPGYIRWDGFKYVTDPNVTIVNAQGEVGPTGEVGPQGPTGIQGVTGLQGIRGATGPIGVTSLSGGSIVFRPGVASNGIFVATSAEVQSALAAGVTSVYVDSSNADAIVAGTWDFRNIASLYQWENANSTGSTLSVPEGSQIQNLRKIDTLLIMCHCTSVPSFDWSYGDTPTLEIYGVTSGGIYSDTDAIISPIKVPHNGNIIINMNGRGASIDGIGASVIDLTTDGIAEINIRTGAYIADSMVVGAEGSSLTIQYDAEFQVKPIFSGLLSTPVFVRLALERNIYPNYGTTGNRPAVPITGQQYFDTTLGQQVVWNGTIWTNAVSGNIGSGNTVSVDALAVGTNNTVKSEAFAVGRYNSVATGSFAAGAYNNVTAMRAEAFGVYASAIRGGQIAYSSGQSQGSIGGVGSAQFGELIFSGGTPGAALSEEIQLTTNSGIDGYFTLEASKSYLIEIKLVARKASVGVGVSYFYTLKMTIAITVNSDFSNVLVGQLGETVTNGFGYAPIASCSFDAFLAASNTKLGFIFTGNTSGSNMAINVATYLSWTEILGT